MSQAQLSISLDDYNAILAARTKAEMDLVTVQLELNAAKIADPSGQLPALTAFARDCLTIARFAVANLPPEMIRSWPWRELLRICENIHVLPDCSTNDRDMAIDLVSFAHDCEQHEIRRRSEPKATKITDEEIAAERERLETDPMGQLALQKMRGVTGG